MRRIQTGLGTACALASLLMGAAPLGAQTGPAQPTIRLSPADEVTRIADAYWAESLRLSPTYASMLGLPGYEGKVGDYSLNNRTEQARMAQAFRDQLDRVDVSKLTASERANAMILRRMLNEDIDSNRFAQRAMNFTNRGGWHQDFASLADNSPFRNLADYRSYVDRLAQFPRVNAQATAVAEQAIKGRMTLPCSSLAGYENSITGLIVADDKIDASRFFEPFQRTRPASISEADWNAERDRARSVIRTAILPELRKQADWYTKRYKPACAKADGISAQPGGAAYYQHRIERMTTLNLTADQIHQIGLGEVARIRAEMVEVAKKAGFASREAFIEHLRTDPQYYAKTPEELMEKTARITKVIDGKMPSLFHRLPRLPYGIKEIPADSAPGNTTAYYNPGAPDIGIAGFYYVNTTELNQRPLWEIPALSVHEAVPGHHHQIALQQELDIPDFRKHGASFTAFTEGWGLYSERLGIEMGLYDTPAKDMGRLSYEMWRACRLVVDTGIHAKSWTKAQAVAFMRDNSALSHANIDAEVNRYIAWPGQALAYKLGELKIRELRSMAEQELGARFDLAGFHDAVLEQGSVPLDVLDAQVRDWVAREKAKAK